MTQDNANTNTQMAQVFTTEDNKNDLQSPIYCRCVGDDHKSLGQLIIKDLSTHMIKHMICSVSND